MNLYVYVYHTVQSTYKTLFENCFYHVSYHSLFIIMLSSFFGIINGYKNALITR